MEVEVLNRTDRIKTLKHAVAAAIAVDEVRLINGRVLVAYESLDAAEEGMMIYGGAHLKGAKAAVAINAGDTIYWDNGASVFTNADGAGANTKCGIALADALLADAEVELELDNSVNL